MARIVFMERFNYDGTCRKLTSFASRLQKNISETTVSKPFDPVSFDALRSQIQGFDGWDQAAVQAVRQRDAQLTKPPQSLGRLEEIARFMAGWQGKASPRADHVRVHIYAASHGIAAHGVSAFPSEVTSQMVDNFQRGGAAINQICRTFDFELSVEAFDLHHPSDDFSARPALSEDDCLDAMRRGARYVRQPCDLLCLGEMGIGNTTAAAALAAALYDGDAEKWTGLGTGIDAARRKHKSTLVARSLKLHGTAPFDPLYALRCFGGWEMAAIVGAVIQARYASIPVILDGFTTTAAAAVLHECDSHALDHCLIGHQSAEAGHRHLADHLGKKPLLDLAMCLGEASGAALAAAIVKGALACHNDMATFADAGVSEKCSE